MKKMRKMRLFQKDAYIGIDFLDKKAEVIQLHEEGMTNTFTMDIETNNGKKTIAIAAPNVAATNAIQEELISFKNAIINNTETEVTAIDGYRAMEVAYLILDKINKNMII